MSTPSEPVADIGGFIKKYMDAAGQGDMELMGRASYDLMALLAASRKEGYDEGYEQGRQHEIAALIAALESNLNWQPRHFAGVLRSRLELESPTKEETT